MSNEGHLDKRKINLRVELETCRAVEKKFALPSDKDQSSAFIRALQEATKDVALTLQDLDIIRKEMEANGQKRMEDRAKKRNRRMAK